MNEIKRVKATVSGRVQGVFFRAETKKAADRIGIKGYVKNLANGDVQALFVGDEQQMAEMIKWCHKGSPSARVDKVQTIEDTSGETFNAFEIRY